jgi:hypothetical protein
MAAQQLIEMDDVCFISSADQVDDVFRHNLNSGLRGSVNMF